MRLAPGIISKNVNSVNVITKVTINIGILEKSLGVIFMADKISKLNISNGSESFWLLYLFPSRIYYLSNKSLYHYIFEFHTNVSSPLNEQIYFSNLTRIFLPRWIGSEHQLVVVPSTTQEYNLAYYLSLICAWCLSKMS